MRTRIWLGLTMLALCVGATPAQAKATAQAVFGGGCFWCLEAAFEELRGVDAVVSGYAGGKVPHPTYEAVCGGRTGHAEVVRISYDPGVISYSELLQAFFVVHDPTTKNRQGADVGSQYRSIILTRTPAEAEAAKATIRALGKAFPKPIVTEVAPLRAFYLAEDYHQDYFARHPDQPYCVAVVAPKVEKLRHTFLDRLKKKK